MLMMRYFMHEPAGSQLVSLVQVICKVCMYNRSCVVIIQQSNSNRSYSFYSMGNKDLLVLLEFGFD